MSKPPTRSREFIARSEPLRTVTLWTGAGRLTPLEHLGAPFAAGTPYAASIDELFQSLAGADISRRCEKLHLEILKDELQELVEQGTPKDRVRYLFEVGWNLVPVEFQDDQWLRTLVDRVEQRLRGIDTHDPKTLDRVLAPNPHLARMIEEENRKNSPTRSDDRETLLKEVRLVFDEVTGTERNTYDAWMVKVERVGKLIEANFGSIENQLAKKSLSAADSSLFEAFRDQLPASETRARIDILARLLENIVADLCQKRDNAKPTSGV